jgi:hypothetical protein
MLTRAGAGERRWWSKEKKIKPAAGKKPHIAFILVRSL